MMSRVVEDAHAEIEVVVTAVTAEADGVVSLTLARLPGGSGEPAGEPLPHWSPGSHIDVLLPSSAAGTESPEHISGSHHTDGPVRQYSLCGPVSAPTWRIGVLREPAGRGGSAYVHDHVAVGDRLRVRGPRNNFPLQPADEYLLLAGGIGITPLLPMLAELTATGRPWRLVYGGKQRAAMAFGDELAEYGDRVVLWPQDTHGLLPLAAELDRLGSSSGPSASSGASVAVYCCGPEPLLEAVEKACAERGLAAPHVERFAPRAGLAGPDGGDGDASGDREFDLVLERSGGRYRVPVGRSIIEVLEAAGVDVPSSCQEGVCGTCEQRIVAGTVDHRDSLLSEAEKAENEYLMICVSRASSAELVLDL